MFAGARPSQFDAVQYVEPAVNRQPGFRRELVEHIPSFYNSILKFPSYGSLQMKISISASFHLHIFMKRRKICSFSNYVEDTF